VNGHELFAWPGAGRFEDRELRDMVGGTSGTGAFGLWAKSIFMTNTPSFTYRGDTVWKGRRTVQYDFRVARLISGYKVRVGNQEGIVGYHGSFWADALSLDLVRLEMAADDIPPNLDLQTSHDAIEYARTRIGEGEFLLPTSSQLSLIDLAGNEYRNQTSYRGCRQYTGESVVTFGDPPPDAGTSAPKAAPEPIVVPPGTLIEVRLAREIPPVRSAVGDPVTATVTREVRRDGTVAVPKGAQLSGRITRFERRNRSGDLTIVGIVLDTIEFQGRRGEFHGTLEEIRNAAGPNAPVIATVAPHVAGWRTLNLPALQAKPGEGLLMFRSRQAWLPKGFGMVWRAE
jgi:hypothetical protein